MDGSSKLSMVYFNDTKWFGSTKSDMFYICNICIAVFHVSIISTCTSRDLHWGF